VERLSSLLRSSLDPKETVPLHQELKLVGDYLEIQRTRLGDRLRYDMDIRMGAGIDPTVPPFAVQTVVENALKHVAALRQEGVALHLSAVRSDGRLVVEVTDDGPGFDPDAMKAGHGLDNLQGRLRALYGERARIEFLRQAGGMTVRLCLPAQ
jgi:LytS/YehU family sensor histidine kinase